MIDFLYVWWLRFISACGLDRFSAAEIPGLLIVILAGLLVIYAFYKAAVYSFWPAEPKYEGIKKSIFNDEGENEN